MINIGRKLIGEDAAKYLPFALTKARQFAATFTNAYISRTFIVDTATVMVEVFNKGQAQVTIWGGGGGYEFFCTSPEIKRSAFAGFDFYLGSAVRITIKEEDGKQAIKATPSGSTLLLSPEGKWRFEAKPENTSTLFRAAMWQIQGLSEFVSFPKIKAKTTVTSAWCASSDVLGCNARGLAYRSVPSVGGHDIMYDVPPTGHNSGAQTSVSSVPDADWYRRATMATVEDPKFGNRTFFLMTTISGELVVYTDSERDNAEADNSPYSAQQIKTNVPSKYAKTIAIPMPTNARKPNKKARDNTDSGTPGEEWKSSHLRDFQQYIWKFNSAGTRMACVAYYMAKEMTLGGTPVQFFGADIREELPGLVELAININLIGPNKEDFTVSMEILRDMDPFITDQVFLSCEYTWKISAIAKPSNPAEPFDLEAINPYEQKKDNLVVAEVEVFKEKGTTLLNGSFYAYGWKDTEMQLMQTDLLIKNLTLGTELHRFPLVRPANKRSRRVKTFWHDSAVVIAIDLRIMAWVIQRDIVQVNSANPNLFVNARHDYDDAGDYSDDWWDNRTKGYVYDEVTRATKLETWVYNRIEEEQYLSPNSPLNSLIDSRTKGEGLQPSQDRKRYEKVVPSATLQDEASFPFNKAGYTIPDPNYRDQWGNPDSTMLYETDETVARIKYLGGTTQAVPIACLMFGRISEFGYSNWVFNGYSLAEQYMKYLIWEYSEFSFTPATWEISPQGAGYWKSAVFSVGAGLSPLPIGAYVYNHVGIPSICVEANDGFTIHPDGHWAVSTHPTISYDGPTTANSFVPGGNDPFIKAKGVAEVGFCSAAFITDTGKFVQGFVDIISIKSKTGRLRTSHLEQYNSAYEREDTKQKYYIKLAEVEGTIGFTKYGAYKDMQGTTGTYSVYYTAKYRAISRLDEPSADPQGENLKYYLTTPLVTPGAGYLPDIDLRSGKPLPPPVGELEPSEKYLIGIDTRYHCGALMDARPSYLLWFLGPDYPGHLPNATIYQPRIIESLGRGWSAIRYSEQKQSEGFIEHPVLAGSRVFYGELKGTNRVDHEDDK